MPVEDASPKEPDSSTGPPLEDTLSESASDSGSTSVSSETDSSKTASGETQEQARGEKNTTEPDSETAEESAPSHVYCNECGWENPVSANFCSQCGTELQDLSATESSAAPAGTRKVAADLPKAQRPGEAETSAGTEPAAGKEEEQQLMSQQLMMTVGTAVVVLIALFFVTLWSQNQSWSSEASTNGDRAPQSAAGLGGGATAGPAASQFGGQDIATLIAENGTEMPASVAAQADSIKGQLPNVEGDVKRTLQEQLVNLYVGASAFGRAARLQKEMAETSQDPDDWRRTGDLFYNWMEKVGAESNGKNPAIPPIGRRAIAVYEEVLDENPGNHDVRTDMATVLLRSNDPMRGVEELNQVLNEDSTFVPARFNKGIALLWIGRYEQAIEQFEAVQELTGEESAQYQQAAEAIRLVREEMNANQSPASSSEPPIAPSG